MTNNTITKIFVEVFMLDMEGRNGSWCTTKRTYEEAVAKMDAWTDAVRMVEKSFDPETFKITTTEIKRTEKVLEGLLWKGEVRETRRYAG